MLDRLTLNSVDLGSKLIWNKKNKNKKNPTHLIKNLN
jgi:hypothetical protein